MRKTTKGALAAGTAVVLLTGGAGTLAYWSDSTDGGSGTINSGKLTLDGSAENGAWTHNGQSVADPQAVVAVPGDTFAYAGSYTIEATGTDLRARLDVTEGTATGGLVNVLAVTPEFQIDGVELAAPQVITSGDAGNVVSVAIEIDFPFGSTADNTSQGQALDLTDYQVTLTQTDKLAG